MLSFLWIMIIATSFFWNYRQLVQERERIAFEEGRSFFKQMIITRQWNTSHGGEEFIVVLPDTTSNGVIHVAERIRLHIEELGIIHEKLLPGQIVTLSLGVATSKDTTRLAIYEKLIQYADTALYTAKDQGRNQV